MYKSTCSIHAVVYILWCIYGACDSCVRQDACLTTSTPKTVLALMSDSLVVPVFVITYCISVSLYAINAYIYMYLYKYIYEMP